MGDACYRDLRDGNDVLVCRAGNKHTIFSPSFWPSDARNDSNGWISLVRVGAVGVHCSTVRCTVLYGLAFARRVARFFS